MIWRFGRCTTDAFALHEHVDLTGSGVIEADAEIIAHEPRRRGGRQPHRRATVMYGGQLTEGVGRNGLFGIFRPFTWPHHRPA